MCSLFILHGISYKLGNRKDLNKLTEHTLDNFWQPFTSHLSKAIEKTMLLIHDFSFFLTLEENYICNLFFGWIDCWTLLNNLFLNILFSFTLLLVFMEYRKPVLQIESQIFYYYFKSTNQLMSCSRRCKILYVWLIWNNYWIFLYYQHYGEMKVSLSCNL